MADMVSLVELINRRKRQILVHSFLYYQLNENVIPDYQYDMWCKELADLLQEYPDSASESIYFKEFQGFDGSSGYDLPFHYPEIQSNGYRILKYHKEKTSG
jgi:NAD-dependent DNA ligase adenylation domain